VAVDIREGKETEVPLLTTLEASKKDSPEKSSACNFARIRLKQKEKEYIERRKCTVQAPFGSKTITVQ
jgi:hypothetical protein